MNTTVYLIRHGEVQYPTDAAGNELLYGPTAPLSEKGKKQIQTLGRNLADGGVRLDRVFTSPYPRTMETAQIIGKVLGVTDIREVDGLKDVIAPGYEGTSYRELMKKGGNIYAEPLTEDQETLEQLTERVERAFRRIVKENEGKTIAVVGHGDSTRVLYHRLKEGQGLPDSAHMRDEDYLGKGEARKVVIDSSFRLLESESVGPKKEGGIEKKF